MSLIEVNNLKKQFKIYKREKGIKNNIKNLIKREYEIKQAIDDISFSIETGELVGYIGANGAGKSTTIKMLSGIIVPSEGSVLVNGIVPYQNRRENAMNIGVVFGQRSQLNWDLPMIDTYELYKRMYRIDDALYKKNVDMFVEILQMQEFIKTPVRQLSLGQKMRAELSISLLHNPKILYLDEPTIGLDIIAKERIRTFIRELNKEYHTTVILTTHDMKDIDIICDRVIVINKGKIASDCSLQDFKTNNRKYYTISIQYGKMLNELKQVGIKCIKSTENEKVYYIQKKDVPINLVLSEILHSFEDIYNMEIREMDIEEIVKEFL